MPSDRYNGTYSSRYEYVDVAQFSTSGLSIVIFMYYFLTGAIFERWRISDDKYGDDDW